MKIILIGTFLFLIGYCQAQTTFQKAYGGPNDDRVYSVKQTSDGGYIMVGATESFTTSSGIYLIKTDSYGDTLWTKIMEGDYEIGESVQQSADGGYIISGTAIDSNGISVMYLLKTDSNGNVLWRKGYEGDEGYSVFQNNDHGYIICGTAYVGFTTDISLTRTDSLGNALWVEYIGIGGSEYAYSVQQTRDSGFIIGGLVGPSVYYALLVKVSSNGSLEWYRAFHSGTTSFLGRSVQQTRDGGYILAGYTYPHSNQEAPLLVKTNSLGNVLWSKKYSSPSFSNVVAAYSVQQTSDDGYVVAGSNWVGSKTIPFVFKTDSVGSVMWGKQFPNSNSAVPTGGEPFVQQTSDGGYILSCVTDSLGAGGKDFCLIKVDATGTSGCFDSSLTLIDSAITTMNTTLATSIFPASAAVSPNDIISAGGTVTTLCSDINSINNTDSGSKLVSFFPNPFSKSGTISFSLRKSEKVSIKIFDSSGRLVSTPANKVFEPGESQLKWNASGLNAGIYYLQFQSEEEVVLEKLILAKQ